MDGKWLRDGKHSDNPQLLVSDVYQDQKDSISYQDLTAMVKSFTAKITKDTEDKDSIESDPIITKMLDMLSIPLAEAESSSPPSSEQ